MNGVWILKLCVGISSWGCGHWFNLEYPSRAECYEALRLMRVESIAVAESEKRRSHAAICYPKKENAR